MRGTQVDRIAEQGTGSGRRHSVNWTPPRRDPPELILARQALDRQRIAEAERYLRRALDVAPDWAEVRTLMGLIHERLGEHHAAYQCYRLAFILDPDDPDAADGLRRYCLRFGFDPANKAINPAGVDSV